MTYPIQDFQAEFQFSILHHQLCQFIAVFREIFLNQRLNLNNFIFLRENNQKILLIRFSSDNFR